MSEEIILNPTWSPMQIQICIGAFIVFVLFFLILRLGEHSPNELLVDFEIKSNTVENGHPVIVVQANNDKELSDKLGHVTYKGGHLVITRTGEKEFTVRGHS